jgi:pimeloyl-ACP methyl ester carboxylesterase
VKISLLVLLGIVVAVYALLCAWVYARQRSMIYYPVPERATAAGEALSLPVAGAVLKVWTVRRPGSRALIYFGGNAEDVSASLDEFALAIPDRSLYFVNYRGYGGSTGAPTEAALVADALAIFDSLRKDYDEIAVVGRSLGSGVAVQLAATRPVSKLVLVTPFDSLARVGQGAMPWLPVALLMRDRYESTRFAPRVVCPTLLLVAAKDAVIPPAHAAALLAAFATGRARAVEVPGAGHNDIQLWPQYYRDIAGFLR